MIEHRRPEELLRCLGVTAPAEINVCALADVLGVEVRCQPLSGCEARILGTADRAIITVNVRSTPTRRRFSVAHELGHWRWHRGRSLMCKPEDVEAGDRRRAGPISAERVADRYAAGLLMPEYLVRPLLAKIDRVDFQHVQAVAEAFNTSFLASAIRLVELNLVLNLLVCHGPTGRRWFVRARDIPDRWFPCGELSNESLAFDMMFSHQERQRAELVPAHAWFDRQEAYRYEIMEQSRRLSSGEVLTLLSLTEDKMLDEST